MKELTAEEKQEIVEISLKDIKPFAEKFYRGEIDVSEFTVEVYRAGLKRGMEFAKGGITHGEL